VKYARRWRDPVGHHHVTGVRLTYLSLPMRWRRITGGETVSYSVLAIHRRVFNKYPTGIARVSQVKGQYGVHQRFKSIFVAKRPREPKAPSCYLHAARFSPRSFPIVNALHRRATEPITDATR
jgi:hypothetical protein